MSIDMTFITRLRTRYWDTVWLTRRRWRLQLFRLLDCYNIDDHDDGIAVADQRSVGMRERSTMPCERYSFKVYCPVQEVVKLAYYGSL